MLSMTLFFSITERDGVTNNFNSFHTTTKPNLVPNTGNIHLIMCTIQNQNRKEKRSTCVLYHNMCPIPQHVSHTTTCVLYHNMCPIPQHVSHTTTCVPYHNICPIPQHVQLQQQSVPKCFPLYQVQVDFFLLLFLRGVTSIFFSPFVFFVLFFCWFVGGGGWC